MLEALGLDRDAESVYREMLADPSGELAELSARVTLPEAAYATRWTSSST